MDERLRGDAKSAKLLLEGLQAFKAPSGSLSARCRPNLCRMPLQPRRTGFR